MRNTFDPDHTGTILRGADEMEIYRPVSGVTVDKDQARLAILKVPDKPGVAGEIFASGLNDPNVTNPFLMAGSSPTSGLVTGAR